MLLASVLVTDSAVLPSGMFVDVEYSGLKQDATVSLNVSTYFSQKTPINSYLVTGDADARIFYI